MERIHFMARTGGFSLAEILICLAILGIVSAFTIPVLTQDSQPNLAKKQTLMAQNTIYMMATAYEKYRQQNPNPVTMRSSDLYQYLNYVRLDTSTVIENIPGYATLQCSNTEPCLILHNGGILHTWYDGFCDSPRSALAYDFAPSNKVTNNPGNKSLRIYLYIDGRIRTPSTQEGGIEWNANQASGTNCSYLRGPGTEQDPAWFKGFNP